MYATRASQLAKTITMACSVQKQPTQNITTAAAATTKPANATVPSTPKTKTCTPRGSLPTDVSMQPPLEFQWPPAIPVSSHTSNLRLNMMNQDPKDLHTARAMIEELRSKVRFQTEHIMKWRKAYAIQVQQHYRYQKEKTDQMNALTSQLLLLESRLKRKQKQISHLLNHRESTIQRQQKLIDTLSTRLSDNGIESIDTSSYVNELDSLNDSDSAVVLEEIDSDSNMTLGTRRKSSGGGLGGDGITIVRSISDAIETNLNKYGGNRRNNCFLRRPDILETVYSVEEDPEPTTDVAEKRDKFKNRSDKALSSSSTEGQIDNVAGNGNTASTMTTTTTTTNTSNNLNAGGLTATIPTRLNNSSSFNTISSTESNTKELAPPAQGSNQQSLRSSASVTSLKTSPTKLSSSHSANNNNYKLSNNVIVPQLHTTPASVDDDAEVPPTLTSYNRVMSNHRSVTKPKDVKYKRINKAKSKSLEELRGRLKNLVERGGSVIDTPNNGYMANVMPQTAQSYA